MSDINQVSRQTDRLTANDDYADNDYNKLRQQNKISKSIIPETTSVVSGYTQIGRPNPQLFADHRAQTTAEP
jgi:hypothetical protein